VINTPLLYVLLFRMVKWTTRAYHEILTGSIGAYKKGDLEKRCQILKEIKEKIRDSTKKAEVDPPDNLNQVNSSLLTLF
jgi:hypothetical protein